MVRFSIGFSVGAPVDADPRVPSTSRESVTAPAPDRYARQRQFTPIGPDGQASIERSDVSVLGCGALGTVAAELLCRAGVGRIRVIDRDIVEWTNLQRQSLFDGDDAARGNSKAEAAVKRLAEINDGVELIPHVVDVSPGNIRSLLEGTDLVIDATDNFPIRFLLNDWALATRSVWVHGGCVGAGGQVRLFDGASSPCFRCLVPEPPPSGLVETCDTAGVLGSATSAIASWQVTEAIKWISGNRESVNPAVLSIDFWNNRVRQIRLTPRFDCGACGRRDFRYLNGEAMQSADAALCGRDAVQVNPPDGRADVDLREMERRWEPVGPTQRTRFFIRLNLDDGIQLTLFRDGRVIVHGTDEVSRARGLVDRFIGR
ncbi:molybdopterin biosynthesis protein MoeB [Roseiconus nitratireducens]|uniref:Molybdopterin biosynthesis protein MoeB n=1 Tax=Roseiconus nitratireducens TaxID=2605748 RepID=A0A5M6CYR5_9BACT|nr:ThiF family adenylyltransferase [Roseiconus nitratireducens]KAA5540016.1 molybdopterin biosynthesis protein MoeB [Roseiconus nitratireducens]